MPTMIPRRRREEWLLTLPTFFWLTLFFIIPTVIVLAIAFKPAAPHGGFGEGWTLRTLMELGNPNYPAIVFRTLWISAVATALCILIALPVGYCLARASRKWRQFLMLLVVIPFWTNFLIRIFAWKQVLHPEGILKKTLVALHLVAPDATLLYNASAVMLVMVYTYLPFAILPIYAAAEKFDFSLLEAAQDLGSSRLGAFYRIFIPGIRRGLLTATLMVLIPALGAYVIPDIVGGPTSEMIGNKIAQRTFVDRNLPHASALTGLLLVTVLVVTGGLYVLVRMRKIPRALGRSLAATGTGNLTTTAENTAPVTPESIADLVAEEEKNKEENAEEDAT